MANASSERASSVNKVLTTWCAATVGVSMRAATAVAMAKAAISESTLSTRWLPDRRSAPSSARSGRRERAARRWRRISTT